MRILLSFFLCLSFTTAFAAKRTSTVDNKIARVMVQEIRETQNVKRVITPSKVEAKINSLVISEIEGNVTRILKPLGSRVKKGEIVLYIENKDPGFTYAPVPVRSPISGVVSQFAVPLMARVSKGAALFSIIDPKSLKLVAEIASADLPMLGIGATGYFLTNLSERESGFRIRLAGVSPTIDPRTGTASAEMEFAHSDLALPVIGSVGHSIFEVSAGRAILIPESALIFQEGKPYVRILDQNQVAKRKPVVIGEQQETLLKITSGLTPGQKIVLRASRPIKDGEKVSLEENGVRK